MNSVSTASPVSPLAYMPLKQGHGHENTGKRYYLPERIRLLTNTSEDRETSAVSNKSHQVTLNMQTGSATERLASNVTHQQSAPSAQCSPVDGAVETRPPKGRSNRWILLGGLTLITTAVGAFIYNREQFASAEEPSVITITPSSLIGYRPAARNGLNPYRYNFGLG
ncbi:MULTISPECIES: hypothetical protein [unclassified Symbiopectobacterium]|uniref:hypothetical protein n=1 Tax=unclassified Symbiopectobacterium TaxID=2794573 RepID=UPI002225D975|nr:MULTISPECIES: hypothetical protein [unclassified Symbiopectobacterium]MCW2475918.1 hypothetical protein [Candidatus Symbiopectobacterium sp. NZEC151]MCW2481967.1 hypothetical protein [Candidatus Symbiopectobacterium sp. NZEC135]MCW2485854.1 hypothetical protein [Candidatus Symbiopectobacterium sp. NZEC127]